MKHTNKLLKVFLVVGIGLVLQLALQSNANAQFFDDFSSPTLDPAWTVVPGTRIASGFPPPANDFSLTANPGHLRYTLDPMTHSYGFVNGYQPAFPGEVSCCTHDPGLELHRTLGGTDWDLETKVSYHMPFTNGRQFDLRIYFGNGGAGTFFVRLWRVADVNQNNLHVLLMEQTGTTISGLNVLESTSISLGGTIDGTHFFRLKRAGGVLTPMLSDDGVTWNPTWSHDFGSGLDGLEQRVVITGLSWFNTGGSYADYDYISVTPTTPNCVPLPSGMVSWWPGDGDANDIRDSNHGILQNGTAFVSGFVGQAFSLDGIDDFVEVPNSPSMMIAGAFTAEFWFKLNATHDSSSSTSPGFLSKGLFDSINLANNDGRLEVRGPVPRPYSTTNTWLAGTWYYVAVTFDTAEYRIYVNGVQEGSVVSNHSILNNPDNVAIGSTPAFLPRNVTVNGLVDEVSIYNRALSASEIQAIFNAGSAGKCQKTLGEKVVIDVKPNPIKPWRRGKVTVAILTTDDFDATTVDPLSVEFGPNGAKEKHGKGHIEDADGDGDQDMVLHFRKQQTGIQCGDTEARLTGKTTSGQAITGTDAIQTVGCTQSSNIAKNTSRTGFPHPLESDSGWGGGSDVWSIVDGMRSYDSWANGLAFTGGAAGWGGEPGGMRQATIDFGAPVPFDKVVLWWHGVSDTPKDVSLFYWDDNSSQWVSISFTRNYGAIYENGQNGGYSHSDEYLFSEVTGSKVQISFNNLAPAIDGSQMVHGWLYEFEVFGPLVP